MKLSVLLFAIILSGCSSQKNAIYAEPKLQLSHRTEQLVLNYKADNLAPSNLQSLLLKTSQKVNYGRTAYHVTLPFTDSDNTQQRIKFLKDILLAKGMLRKQIKEKGFIKDCDDRIFVTIDTYTVLPPKRDSTLYGDSGYANKTATLTNYLYMIEDVSVLFDDTPLESTDSDIAVKAIATMKGETATPTGGGSAATGIAASVAGVSNAAGSIQGAATGVLQATAGSVTGGAK
jgi:hypothetical protein